MNPDMENYLRPTPVIDCDHPSIREKSQHLTKGQDDITEKAKGLFYFVRDEIRYNFYPSSSPPEELFRASNTLSVGEGFCIPKAFFLSLWHEQPAYRLLWDLQISETTFSQRK